MNCHRGQYGSLAEYYDGFKEIAAAAKANHVIFQNTGLNQCFAGKREGLETNDDGRLIYQSEYTNEALLALMFIKNAGTEFDEYRAGVCNSFAEGTDQWPRTINKAYEILDNFQPMTANVDRGNKRNKNGSSSGTGGSGGGGNDDNKPPTTPTPSNKDDGSNKPEVKVKQEPVDETHNNKGNEDPDFKQGPTLIKSLIN